MKLDRRRVLGREIWSADELDAHHRTTFALSVNLMLATTGCTARAEQVPSLIDALAWCSVFRDLDDDLRQGLNNVPSDAGSDWVAQSRLRGVAANERAVNEIARLDDPRARKTLSIFQRSIARFARSQPAPLTSPRRPRPASPRSEQA
jgi:hypothetical protein